MSLLEQASLIVTPNAYKENVLYSVVPNDRSGDLDVVRATTATRVNADGLIEVVPKNLASYSEQFDNAIWSKSNTTVTTNSITAPNGTLTADTITESTANAIHFIAQSVTSYTSGIIITVSFYAKPNGRTSVAIMEGNNIGGNSKVVFNLANGTVTSKGSLAITATILKDDATNWCYCTMSFVSISTNSFYPMIWPTYLDQDSYVGDGVSGFYLWGFQATQSSIPKDYFPTTDRLNIPRLDYSGGGCPSILVEPQRTNEFFRSEEFDNAFWPKSGVTIIANDTISPDGNLTADRVTIVDVGQGTIAKSYSRTNYTLSVFAKKGNSNLISISLLGSNHRADFNLDLGTIIYSSGTGVSPKIEDYGNGWFRCILENVPSITQLRIYAGGIGTAAVNDYIYLWGAQIEAGANATSYIQTVASTVTRNSDVIFNDNFVVANNSNFAVSGEFFLLEDRNELYGRSGAIILRLFLTGRTSFSYFISFQRHSNKFNLRYKNDLGNNLQVSTDEDFNFGVWNKYAVSVEVGVGFKIAINGVLEFFPDTSIVAMTTDRISTNAYDNSNMGGKIQNIITYPTALTDEQCIALTTI